MLPTPTGWTTIEAVQVGDMLFDEHGQPCRVTYITPIMYDRPCYDVVFDDGTVIVADAEHRWLTKTKAVRKAESKGRRITGESKRAGRPQNERRMFPRIVTTEEIRQTLRTANGREINHSIDLADPLDCPETDLPIEPYVFGAWLGDGDSAGAVLTTADGEIIDHIRATGIAVGDGRSGTSGAAKRYAIGAAESRRDVETGRMLPNSSLHSALKALDVRNNKHIPMLYQRASITQRTALLQGLMDTDGYVEPNGNCEFVNTNERLARDVWHLVLGLGFKATFGTGRAMIKGRDCGPKYRVSFTPHRPVFRLSRKLMRQHSGKNQKERTRRRYIIDVRPRESVPVRCLTVDSSSHLFLISEACIQTHNTRTGAEYIRWRVESGQARRIGLIAETAADARDVIVEGESGLLAVCPPWNRPKYEPSKRRLTWPNGAIATTYSGDDPEQLRGPQHDTVWADELAKWRYGVDAWSNMEMGLRLSDDPRVVVTTTPRPIPLIKELRDDEETVRPVVNLSTHINRANVSERFVRRVIRRLAGTRLGRQELDAEILEDVPGALWARSGIEATRVGKAPDLSRIVIGVDPSAGGADGETGIVGCGKDADEHGYVLADETASGDPAEWASAVIRAYVELRADKIVAEKNNGGEMVAHVIRQTTVEVGGVTIRGANLPIELVWASRGKHTRAEPIAILWSQGEQRGHFVGALSELEDQCCTWVPGEASPDRMDALVWAMTDLFPNEEEEEWIAPAVGGARPHQTWKPRGVR